MGIGEVSSYNISFQTKGMKAFFCQKFCETSGAQYYSQQQKTR